MNHLRTIDPVTALKGKLNFMKLANQQILSLLHLANTIGWTNQSSQSSKGSSLENVSLE